MSVVDQQFAYLFRGRTDRWGAVHGQSVEETVTPARYSEHLWVPDRSLGIYPLVKTAAGVSVPWGCTDIDNAADPEACLPLARNLLKVLGLVGITGWLERTKGKGYHVWVFVEGWVPAEQMRNALLFAHQVAGVAPTEVNPKSLSGGKGGNGNYVNLPYAFDWDGTGKRCVLDADTGMPMELDVFTSAAMSSLSSPQTIASAAARYVPPPPPPRVDIEAYAGGDLQPLVGKLPGLAFTIFNGGPLEGRDRSGTLARLAHLMAEADVFTTGEAVALLMDADARWGKYLERGEPEELENLIARAWGKRKAAQESAAADERRYR